MEYIINEQGCRQLSTMMYSDLKEILRLVGEIESRNTTLKAALGEDYDSIAKSVRLMTAELENVRREMDTICADMQEYIARVQQTRVTLG